MSSILLVENDPDLRPLLDDVLCDAGYETDAVETMAEAEALIGSHRYDLVMSDAKPGDGSGLATADTRSGPASRP